MICMASLTYLGAHYLSDSLGLPVALPFLAPSSAKINTSSVAYTKIQQAHVTKQLRHLSLKPNAFTVSKPWLHQKDSMAHCKNIKVFDQVIHLP